MQHIYILRMPCAGAAACTQTRQVALPPRCRLHATRIANVDSSEAFCASLAQLATEVQSTGDCGTALPMLLKEFGCSGIAPSPVPASAPAQAKGAFLRNCPLVSWLCLQGNLPKSGLQT